MKLGSPGWLAMTVFLMLSGLFAHATVWAQEPIVRTQLAGKNTQPLWVGQSVPFVVEVLVPGYFSGATRFDLPDPDGVLLMVPSSSPVVGSDVIDGTAYTIQRHELRAWPMRSGELSIPSFPVRFSFKLEPLDKQVETAEVATKALQLIVKMPPQAQGLGTIISARNLQVEEIWSPQPDAGEVKAGTAFKRTITFAAPDVPGMLFPAFPADPIDGLGVYAKSTLEDESNRGSLTGIRHDEIAYVCKQAGQYIIPATSYTWFDLDSLQLKTKTFPAQTLNVVPNADLASANDLITTGPGNTPVDWRKVILILGLAALFVLAACTPFVRRKVVAFVGYLSPTHLEPLNPKPDYPENSS